MLNIFKHKDGRTHCWSLDMIADELKILQENAQKSFAAIQTYIEGKALTQELHEIEQQLRRLLQRL